MGFFFLMTFKIYFDKLEKIKAQTMRSIVDAMLGVAFLDFLALVCA